MEVDENFQFDYDNSIVSRDKDKSNSQNTDMDEQRNS